LHVAILTCIYIYREEAWGSLERNSCSLFAILKNVIFTVFYGVLCSFHHLIKYGISSTCGQHTWDMLSAVRFFLKHVFQVLHFKVAFVETSGIAGWLIF
jgi:hypothetical protein